MSNSLPASRNKYQKYRSLFIIFPVLVILLLILYIALFDSSTHNAPVQPPPTDLSSRADSGKGNIPGKPIPSPGREDEKPETIQTLPSSTPKPAARSSQTSETQNPTPMKVVNGRSITAKENFIHPRWSPDGMDVVCTKHNFKGLYLVSSDGSQIRELSDQYGVGYNVEWSADGTKLIIKQKDGKVSIIDISGQESSQTADDVKLPEERIYAKDDNIYIKDPQSGEVKNLTNGEDNFFDPHLSPDGACVAYQGLTTGLHVQNLASGEVIDIGQGSNFQWTPDSMGLIYNVTQDDGMNIIAGDIYFAYTDGSGVFNITNTPDIIELHPSISPDGSHVTYEVDGQIFVADIQK